MNVGIIRFDFILFNVMSIFFIQTFLGAHVKVCIPKEVIEYLCEKYGFYNMKRILFCILRRKAKQKVVILRNV